MQDIGAWGWRTTIKSVTRGIGQHCGVVDVLFILLAFSSPPSNKRMPAHRWSWISTVSGHFAFLFDTSESIRLVVIAEPTVWLYNRLMPNQSIASMPPIAGQLRYPLNVLYTVDFALQGKNAIHDNMLNRRSILSSSKWMRFTRVSQVSALHRICLLAKLFQRLLLFWGMVAKPCPKDATS